MLYYSVMFFQRLKILIPERYYVKKNYHMLSDYSMSFRHYYGETSL